jgi:arabinogalactan oligomer/maltooligosaccharide transport system substrate-binding protein
MEKQALAAKKKTKSQVGIAVQQGSGGDAFHMYPFFSGLGGYIFGTNKAGNLDPSDIGLANPKFLKNAPMIDKWNKEGLIRCRFSDSARDLFTRGGGVLHHGPLVPLATSRSPGRHAISAFPQIVPLATPFLGCQGFMVTKFPPHAWREPTTSSPTT